MTVAVGIDIGSVSHAVAVCREGAQEAERQGLKIAANRGGFDDLDAWLRRQPEPVARVVMESSGHYWFNLASHLSHQGYPVAVVNPLEAKYFSKRRLQRSKRPRRCAHTGGVRHGRPASDP